jgi:hypothetical protein
MQFRFTRVVEAAERLITARPGDRLAVNFQADAVEATVRRGPRRIGTALAAGAAILPTGYLPLADRVNTWIPIGVGTVAGLLTLGFVLDIARRN